MKKIKQKRKMFLTKKNKKKVKLWKKQKLEIIKEKIEMIKFKIEAISEYPLNNQKKYQIKLEDLKRQLKNKLQSKNQLLQNLAK